MASYGVTFNSTKAQGMKQLKLHNIVAFLGQDPVRCKIVVDNKCLQHAENFKYRGCETSNGKEKDIQRELAKLSQILGNINNTFKPKLVQKFSRIKAHNVLPLPILVHESEFWTLRKKG
jgi:hypothetical protein